MIWSPKVEDLLRLARGMRLSGKDLDETLAELRSQGASIIDSLNIVIEVEQVGLGEAKAIVDASPTWADMRPSNRELREAAIKVMDDAEGELGG